jgi:DNA-nicking Smr family endonuclease
MVKDVDLFAVAMAGVKPLDRKRRATRPVAATPPPALRATSPVRRGRVGVGDEAALDADDGSFDREISRALSRGKLAPEASLDLHGMTLAAAERAVTRFLERAVERDLRVVLIVTGKGLRPGVHQQGGRIRSEFVGWLNRADNRARVRAVRAAHLHHGGSGAFYLLLRRRSSARSRSLRATPQR